MKHAAVAKIVALFRIEQSFQLFFYFCRVFCVNEPQQICYSDKMRVRNNCRLAVDIADYLIRGLSADSRELDKLLDGIRHF